jgi:hypothetical protein
MEAKRAGQHFNKFSRPNFHIGSTVSTNQAARTVAHKEVEATVLRALKNLLAKIRTASAEVTSVIGTIKQTMEESRRDVLKNIDEAFNKLEEFLRISVRELEATLRIRFEDLGGLIHKIARQLTVIFQNVRSQVDSIHNIASGDIDAAISAASSDAKEQQKEVLFDLEAAGHAAFTQLEGIRHAAGTETEEILHQTLTSLEATRHVACSKVIRAEKAATNQSSTKESTSRLACNKVIRSSVVATNHSATMGQSAVRTAPEIANAEKLCDPVLEEMLMGFERPKSQGWNNCII